LRTNSECTTCNWKCNINYTNFHQISGDQSNTNNIWNCEVINGVFGNSWINVTNIFSGPLVILLLQF